MPDFRKQILEQMELKSISRGELAKLTGLHYFTICNYLKGKTDVKAENLSKMIEALGV